MRGEGCFLLSFGERAHRLDVVRVLVLEVYDLLQVDAYVVAVRVLHALHLRLDVAQVRLRLRHLVGHDLEETANLVLSAHTQQQQQQRTQHTKQTEREQKPTAPKRCSVHLPSRLSRRSSPCISSLARSLARVLSDRFDLVIVSVPPRFVESGLLDVPHLEQLVCVQRVQVVDGRLDRLLLRRVLGLLLLLGFFTFIALITLFLFLLWDIFLFFFFFFI